MTTVDTPTFDELVAAHTGGMVPADLPDFAGSERLRPDGRPRAELRAELRRIPNARNALTVALALVYPPLIIAFVIWSSNIVVAVAAFPLMAIAQNRMYILHHEAAHRLLFSNRKINDVVGVTVLGWIPLGTGTHHYRRGHSNHHRDEFGPKEPDFLLYSFYPITSASLRRKLRRDAVGISAYRQLKPRFTGIFQRKYFINSARFFGMQLAVFALFFAAGSPWLYPLLWVLPYITVYQVMNRLRSIAEHGGMTRSSDRRETSHHVRQGILSRIMAPLSVGYHVAHHVDSGVPLRNLPRFHRILVEDGYLSNDIIWPNYRTLWIALVAQSDAPSTVAA